MTVSRENLTTWLRDAYAMENQAIEILKKQVSRLEHYPELRAKVSSHLDESHRQAWTQPLATSRGRTASASRQSSGGACGTT